MSYTIENRTIQKTDDLTKFSKVKKSKGHTKVVKDNKEYNLKKMDSICMLMLYFKYNKKEDLVKFNDMWIQTANPKKTGRIDLTKKEFDYYFGCFIHYGDKKGYIGKNSTTNINIEDV